jgi:hypothetical protein
VKYKAGYKYQLVEDITFPTQFRPCADIVTEFIILTTLGELTLKAGFCSDGPSGPTIDTPNFIQGSFLHDGLYQLCRWEMLSWKDWRKCDHELARQCALDGMWKIRIQWIMVGLKIAGGASARPSKTKRVRQAP